MGWLFGKKKVPKVPFPTGVPVDEKELRFPAPGVRERVIAPRDLKEAVGFEKNVAPPSAPQMPLPEKSVPQVPSATIKNNLPSSAPLPPRQRMQFPNNPVSPFSDEGPLFIKKEVYQRLLGEMDDLKHMVHELREINKSLENSEYNEENNFSKLRNSIRIIHDKLLQIDKTMFKSQGD